MNHVQVSCCVSLCLAASCCVMLYLTVSCCVMLCHAVSHCVMLRHAVSCCVLLDWLQCVPHDAAAGPEREPRQRLLLHRRRNIRQSSQISKNTRTLHFQTPRLKLSTDLYDTGGVHPDLPGRGLQVWTDYGSRGAGGSAGPRLRHSHEHRGIYIYTSPLRYSVYTLYIAHKPCYVYMYIHRSSLSIELAVLLYCCDVSIHI